MKTGAKIMIIVSTVALAGTAIFLYIRKKKAGQLASTPPPARDINQILREQKQEAGVSGKFVQVSWTNDPITKALYPTLIVPEFDPASNIKAGDGIKISSSYWKDMDGKTTRIYKIFTPDNTPVVAKGMAMIALDMIPRIGGNPFIVYNDDKPILVPIVGNVDSGTWQTTPALKSGGFDWVGKADYGDKTNFYAGIHILDFKSPAMLLKAGDNIRIVNSNWDAMEGKTVSILKLNPVAETAILNVEAPNEAVNGQWQKAETASADGGYGKVKKQIKRW